MQYFDHSTDASTDPKVMQLRLEHDGAAVDAYWSLVEQMHREGCCVTVHGSAFSDRPMFIHCYLGKCISRIYTDTWSPCEAPPAP